MRFALAFVAILVVSWASTGKATKLTEEQKERFEKLFVRIDKNNDGSITIDEFGAAMKFLRQDHTEDEIQKIFNVADDDGNGAIDLDEFLTIMENRYSKKATQKAFQVYDKDRNGFISAAELKHVEKSIGEKITDEEADEMIREADTDGDGQLNYEEFETMMS